MLNRIKRWLEARLGPEEVEEIPYLHLDYLPAEPPAEQQPIKVYVKNQTGMRIDFCSGIDIERTLEPEEEIAIEVSDGDFMYFDQVREAV